MNVNKKYRKDGRLPINGQERITDVKKVIKMSVF